MDILQELAETIFPDIQETLIDLEKRFPNRQLPKGAMVTRFAPSPTGFLHTGSLFTSLIAWKFAQQTGGIFFLRLEDTDQKREVEGSGNQLILQLAKFNVIPQEGYQFGGDYGPYAQSKRIMIYRTVIKAMVRQGLAYPCFCSSQELEELRSAQEANKVIPGYYGEFARCRHISSQDALARIRSGDSFVMRFRSKGNHEHKVTIKDLIRGQLELSQNDQDIIILKSDGLPTYHFAHLVDDHFMRTTHVMRGEEWLSSLPIHLELFAAMGWEAPTYAHLPVMMKLEEGNRRKLSKRKDPEAAVSYFLEQGYPQSGILEYLLTVANSNYEQWREQNPNASQSEFHLSFDKFSRDGALFDLDKVKFLCKEYLAKLSPWEITEEIKHWSAEYDPLVNQRILSDESYFINIMRIGREGVKPRKDYANYQDIMPHISFFYDDLFVKEIAETGYPFRDTISSEIVLSVLQDYANQLNLNQDESSWFQSVRELGVKHLFCDNVKQFKKNPTGWIGHIGDVSEIIRIALTGRRETPNLFDIQQVLGSKIVGSRLEKVIAFLRN